MKKVLSIILLIAILCFPIHAINENLSPTIKSLYKFNPEIRFEFLDQHFINLDLSYWEPFMLLKEFDENKDWTDYHVDEGFVLFIDKQYELVEVILPTIYKNSTTIYGVFITEEEITFINLGFITDKGSIIFDFSYFPVEDTVMFIVSNQNFREV